MSKDMTIMPGEEAIVRFGVVINFPPGLTGSLIVNRLSPWSDSNLVILNHNAGKNEDKTNVDFRLYYSLLSQIARVASP
jgi:hypothetical protein